MRIGRALLRQMGTIGVAKSYYKDKVYRVPSIRMLGTHAVLSWIRDFVNKHVSNCKGIVRPHKGIHYYGVYGKGLLEFTEFLMDADVPALSRKWDKLQEFMQ